MTSGRTRLLKEGRALFWPWVLITVSGLLPLVPLWSPWSHLESSEHYGVWLGSQLPLVFSKAGFYLGLPLIAALALGREFDDGTYVLLLSQPIHRMAVWRDKFGITLIAVLSAAMAFAVGWEAPLNADHLLAPMAAVWLLLTIPSAMFCVLVARSSAGGFILDLLFVITAFLSWNLYRFLPWSIVAAAAYAVVMLLLGCRALVRFQAKGGLAQRDLLVSGPSFMPAVFDGWFRCRPGEVTRNLIKKELRLLRPLWLITAVSGFGWFAVIVTLRLLHGPTSLWESAAQLSLSLLLGMFMLLALVLAGTLSLGEERAAGTQSWHMTLPVSVGRQWLVKLAMAMLAGLVCGIAIPAGAWIGGQLINGVWRGFPSVPAGAHSVSLLLVWILAFVSFWCSCIRKGTMTAALWVFPVVGSLVFASELGAGVAQELVRGHWLQLPHTLSFSDETAKLLILLPGLLLALSQSYRMFRTPAPDNATSVIRNLVPLVLVVFASSFLLASIGQIRF